MESLSSKKRVAPLTLDSLVSDSKTVNKIYDTRNKATSAVSPHNRDSNIPLISRILPPPEDDEPVIPPVHILTRYERYQELLDPGELHGFSIVPPTHPLRIGLKKILYSPAFDLVVQIIIWTWSLLIWAKNKDETRSWFKPLDVIFAIIFSVEFVLRVLCLGPLMSLRDGWTLLDGFVAVTMWLEYGTFGGSKWNISLAPFRMFRVIFPLGCFSIFRSLRSTMQSLERSLAPLGYIMLSIFFFFFAYAILTLQSYGLSMQRQCIVDSLNQPLFPLRACKYANTEIGCGQGVTCKALESPRNGYNSFDNIGLALLSLFQIHSMDDWVNQFLNPMLQSEPRFRSLTWIICGTTILFVSLIVINLFVAVIVESFAETRKEEKEERREKERLKLIAPADAEIGIDPELKRRQSSRVYQLLETSSVKWAFATVILANTIVLLIYSPTMRRSSRDVTEAAQWVFAIVFVFELGLQLYAHGYRYIFSAGNFLDTVVILLNLLVRIFHDTSYLEPIETIATARNLRVILLIKPLRLLVMAVFESLLVVLNMAIITALTILSFAIVGKQLFIGTMSTTRSRFDTVSMGFFTLFQVVTGDNWLESMFATITNNGNASQISTNLGYTNMGTALIFYIFFFVWGNYIVQNLLIACILENFKLDQDARAGQAIEAPNKTRNRLRSRVQRVVFSDAFEKFIVACVLVSCTVMCLTGPPGREDYIISSSIIQKLGYLFTAVFTLEMLLKMIAVGALGYFNNGWNILDFVTLLITYVDSFWSGNLPGGRVFRALRIVRSLKVVGKNEDMKNVITAILESTKTLGYVALLYVILVVLFGLLGRSFFGRKLWSCSDGGLADIPYPAGYLPGKIDCVGNILATPSGLDPTLFTGQILMPRTWTRITKNFDTTAEAFISLYLVVHGIWTDISFTTMDITGIDLQPVRNANWGYSIFFIVFIFMVRFFVSSLFVAVVLEYYNMAQEKTTPTLLQRNFNHTFKVEIPLHIYRTLNEPVSVWRKYFYILVRSKWLRYTSIIIVSINCFFLCAYFSYQPNFWSVVQSWVDGWCVAFYIAEFLVKYFAFGAKTWSKQWWFIFEAAIAIPAAVLLIPEHVYEQEWGRLGGRVFRILRVLRYIDFIPSVNFLFRTMIEAAMPLLNVTLLIAIINAIFAVVAVSVLGNVRDGQDITISHFNTFGNSFVTLFKVLTGDAWDLWIYDAAVQPPYCTPDDTTADPVSYGDCGTIGSFAFFVSYTLISIFIMLNVLVAVICNQFASYYQRVHQHGIIDPEVMDLFKKHWDLAEFRLNQRRFGGDILASQLEPILARSVNPLILRPDLQLTYQIWARGKPAWNFFCACVRTEIVLQKLSFLDKRLMRDKNARRRLRTLEKSLADINAANARAQAEAGTEEEEEEEGDEEEGGFDERYDLRERRRHTGSHFFETRETNPNTTEEQLSPTTPTADILSPRTHQRILSKREKIAKFGKERKYAFKDNLARQLKIARQINKAEEMVAARLITGTISYETVLKTTLIWLVGDPTAVPRMFQQQRHDLFECIRAHVAASHLSALARGAFIRAQLRKVNGAVKGDIMGTWTNIGPSAPTLDFPNSTFSHLRRRNENAWKGFSGDGEFGDEISMDFEGSYLTAVVGRGLPVPKVSVNAIPVPDPDTVYLLPSNSDSDSDTLRLSDSRGSSHPTDSRAISSDFQRVDSRRMTASESRRRGGAVVAPLAPGPTNPVDAHPPQNQNRLFNRPPQLIPLDHRIASSLPPQTNATGFFDGIGPSANDANINF